MILLNILWLFQIKKFIFIDDVAILPEFLVNRIVPAEYGIYFFLIFFKHHFRVFTTILFNT